MNTQELALELERCTNDVLALLAAAPDEAIFRKPGDSQWSAAEVVEHLILLEFGVLRILGGTSLPPTRAHDAEVPAILDALEDTTRTLHAPPPIAPTGRYQDREKLVTAFSGVRGKLRLWLPDHDVTLLYPDFRHALFGELTGYEWICFVIGHTRRHMQQMQRAMA
ncbi:MAG: hypothetical protein AMXMBFR84_30710 [Candidatus Hydrogenedentota bacterium]